MTIIFTQCALAYLSLTRGYCCSADDLPCRSDRPPEPKYCPFIPTEDMALLEWGYRTTAEAWARVKQRAKDRLPDYFVWIRTAPNGAKDGDYETDGD